MLAGGTFDPTDIEYHFRCGDQERMSHGREMWVFLPLLMDVSLRLGNRAQGEGTTVVSTCGKEVGKMSSESSEHREWGWEGLFKEWPGNNGGYQEAGWGRRLLGTSRHVR